jgi:hypothetical protein
VACLSVIDVPPNITPNYTMRCRWRKPPLYTATTNPQIRPDFSLGSSVFLTSMNRREKAYFMHPIDMQVVCGCKKPLGVSLRPRNQKLQGRRERWFRAVDASRNGKTWLLVSTVAMDLETQQLWSHRLQQRQVSVHAHTEPKTMPSTA